MKIYCSGIGGIGLSAYAAMQHASGHTVSGSDRADSILLDDLRSQGITVHLSQDGSALTSDINLFVYSEAIPKDAPERMRATELGIPQESYFEALGNLSKEYKVIAVCGTSGKSSTTAMVARVLTELGQDPNVIVGTKLQEFSGRNWRKGESNLFVVEACEYRKSFHHLSPDIVLMTNVYGDHYDAFSSVEEYAQAFREFLQKLPEDGVIVTHMQDALCKGVVEGLPYIVKDADVYALPMLSTPGEHMQQNAQLVLGLGEVLGLSEDTVRSALQGFSGTWRRLEKKGVLDGDILVIDDYAHHPLEIRATLKALRGAYADRRIICVFQPHMHNRTLRLYDDMVRAFTDADIVVVPDVYDARNDTEVDLVDLSSFITDMAAQSSVETKGNLTFEETEDVLRKEILRQGDLLVFMGAGTITDLATKMVS